MLGAGDTEMNWVCAVGVHSPGKEEWRSRRKYYLGNKSIRTELLSCKIMAPNIC